MNLAFTKMHGLGNDFIVLDCRKKDIPGLSRVVKRLSDRRRGVGFDQALVLRKSVIADFRMDIYNSDGGRVEMCGNGVRCMANYIWKRGLSRKAALSIETLAGIIRPAKDKDLVRVDMGEPALEGRIIPVKAEGKVIDRPLEIGDRVFPVTCVSMGNPHCVIFVEAVESFPIAAYGPMIETNGFFPKRTNVEFVQVINKNRIRMRVWERGSGETPACGTGACAAAVASNLKGLAGNSLNVVLDGGVLKIEWSKKDNRVYMTGPAVEVYSGEVTV